MLLCDRISRSHNTGTGGFVSVEHGNASPEQAQLAHAFIRRQIADQVGSEVARALVIQYGGSVKADNAASLLSQPDVDGALVGGASLKADEFLAIVRAAIL